MKKTAVKLVAVLATAILALTGCAKNSPNVAATVGTQEISLSQVDAIAKAVATKSPDTPQWGNWRAAVLQVMIQAKLAKQAQQLAGITISDVQRQQVYATNEFYAALAKDPVTAEFIADFVDTNLVLTDSKGQAAIGQVVSTVIVTVNPVFGQWDSTKAQLSGTSGSLSRTLS
ncbi:MAG: hypothetical protein LWW77_06970 [Propionibacteriales bacterium]|nr:hypothetical protein [Propionibacteriales bacterium]